MSGDTPLGTQAQRLLSVAVSHPNVRMVSLTRSFVSDTDRIAPIRGRCHHLRLLGRAKCPQLLWYIAVLPFDVFQRRWLEVMRPQPSQSSATVSHGNVLRSTRSAATQTFFSFQGTPDLFSRHRGKVESYERERLKPGTPNHQGQ